MRGDPLYISNDGLAITSDCGRTDFCSWHVGERRVRILDMRPSCPFPRHTVNTVIHSSPGGQYLLVTCISNDNGHSSVILHVNSGKPERIAVFHGFEGDSISADGTTAILGKATTTWVYRAHHLQEIVGYSSAVAVSPNARFFTYFGHRNVNPGPGTNNTDFEVYDALTGRTRSLTVACPPPGEVAPCFEGGFVSNDGRLLQFSAQPGPGDTTSGVTVVIDDQTGLLSVLSPTSASCRAQGVSSNGSVELYECSSGIFIRTVSRP
jgi:hypothetical protein